MKYIRQIILILTVFLVFGNTIFNGYNIDDELVTRNNQLTAASENNSFFKLFTQSYSSEGGVSYGYRPISLATFYLEHQVFGESPKVSHAINLIFYALLILLIYTLLRKLFKDTNPYILLFISLLFAIHPVHSETVASIKNRDEILCLLFFISAVLISLLWISKRNILLLFGVAIFISFSILSKKSVLPLIFLFPLSFFYLEKLSIRSFLILSACFSIPLTVFAFDYNWIHSLLCFLSFYGFHLGIYFLIPYLKPNQVNLTFLTITCNISSFICFAIALFYQEIILYATGLLLITFLTKNYFKVAIFLSLSFSIIGYFVFDKEFFAWFYLLLLSLNIYLDEKGNLKFQPKLLWLILPFVAVLAYDKNDWLSLVIYSVPLIFLGSVFVNRIIPMVCALLAVCIGVYFSAFNFFQVGLILTSLLLIKQIHFQKFKKVALVIGIFLFCSFMVIDKYDQNQSFFNESELLSQKTIILNEDTSILKEGRKLEFIENTLVAPHSLNERLATGIIVLNEYLRLMVFPKELSFYYGYSKIDTTTFGNYWVWIGILIHIALLVCGVYFIKKHPLISVGIFWYLVSIFLFSNLPVLVAGMVGERLVFTASLGFCILVGGIINWIKPNFDFKNPRALELISLVLLIALAGRTFARNQKWKSHITLMQNDIQHLENSAQANYLLGVNSIKAILSKSNVNQQNIEEIKSVITYFKRAIEIYPNHYNFHIDLGKAYLVLNDLEAAKNSFYSGYLLEPKGLIGLNEIAQTSFKLKQYNEAVFYATAYLKISKANILMFEVAAFSAYYLDDYGAALNYVNKGLTQLPNNVNLLALKADLEDRLIKSNT